MCVLKLNTLSEDKTLVGLEIVRKLCYMAAVLVSCSWLDAGWSGEGKAFKADRVALFLERTGAWRKTQQGGGKQEFGQIEIRRPSQDLLVNPLGQS